MRLAGAIVVDTSSWISYFRGLERDVDLDQVLREGRVWLTPLVVAELYSGFKSHELAKKRFQKFIEDLPLVECDLSHWVRVGDLRSRFQSRGLSVTLVDAHIAQSAIDLRGWLMTEDELFIKMAKIENQIKLV